MNATISARIGATWYDLGDPVGWVPVLAVFADMLAVPDDQTGRRLLNLPGEHFGPFYQVPLGYELGWHAGSA